ncbi:MAG: hypothetical protein AVDCRST_MAG91-3394 [uncultured Sphingomonadaceae bacterium]|uniref:Uncharacterized protein n=1 Tax=uncultured Sphingomonadaceae bacterium TaxID=169976 RepID=A0A6J4TZK2_9SPHN|nr:MAG: hypothetical protein AVDCRST_MAG91-3394 [uncultured Sphingomonadaceae bacterium]
MRPRCVFLGLIMAWVVAIYLPSLLLPAVGLMPLAPGQSLPAATWALADEVAPLAKLAYAAILSTLLLGVRRLALNRIALIAADVALACIAMLAVLALLPEDWSRGFGVGLTGTRFAAGPTLVYLVGAAFSGFTFSLVEANCRSIDDQSPNR